MPRLGDLPPEVILEILDNLPPRDQAAFTRASKWTNAITDRHIYQVNKKHGNSSAIQNALEKADVPALQKALFYGLDPNRREPRTQVTLLHQAVRCRPGYSGGRNPPSQETMSEIIQILLKAGADQRLKDEEHRTPFEIACIEENYGAALVLLDSEHSKVVLNQSAVNQTLHHVVEMLGNYTLPSVSWPLQLQEDYEDNLTVYRANQRELLRRVLSRPGVNVNCRRNHVYRYGPDGVKFTPLQAALTPRCTGGRGLIKPDIQVVRMLLEAGARPNATCPASGYNTLGMVVTNLADGCWGACDLSSLDSTAQVLPPEEIVDFIKLFILHGARPEAGGMEQCPFRRALEAATLHDKVTDRQAQERVLATIKAMLDAKQPDNPTEWLLKKVFLDNIVNETFSDRFYCSEWEGDLTCYTDMLGLFRLLRDYGIQAGGLWYLGDDNHETCMNHNIHQCLRRIASRVARTATGASMYMGWAKPWNPRTSTDRR